MMFNIYNYLTKLSPIIRQNRDRVDDIADSFSDTQLRSKQWLIAELAKITMKQDPRVLILGGWYGSFLVPMLNNRGIQDIILTDINPDVVRIAKQLHNCTSFVLDAEHPSQQFAADIVINTSCEHMKTIGELTSSNTNCLYVLQSCDNDNDPGHINICTNTDAFVAKTNLTKILFKGRMHLGHKNRFMVIGYK